MADEQTTDVTNSQEAETPTVAAVDQGTTTTSTTEETGQTSESQQETDESNLDDGTLLGGDEEQEQADEAPALTGAPEGDEGYTLDLGEDAPFDIAAEDLEAITPLAKELNLSNAGLSRLAQEGVPLIQAAAQRAMVSDVVATRKAWEADARAMVQGGKLADGTDVVASPIFSGENVDAVLTTGARAIDRFTNGPDGQPLMFPAAKVNAETGEMEAGTFRDFLKTTGLGNHPAMVQFAYMAGKAISEDSDFERGGHVAQSKLTREQKYYGSRTT